MFTMKNVERERKLRFLFDIYDIDGDGLICNSELYKVDRVPVQYQKSYLDLGF